MPKGKKRAKKKRVPKRPGPGRPTDYTDEIAIYICSELAGGRSLVKICEEPTMPARSVVFEWLKKHETFANLYRVAKEECGDALFDQVMEVARNKDRTGSKEKIMRDRLIVDSLKWAAAKLKPKSYSDRISAEVSGADGGPIVVEITRFSEAPKPEAPSASPTPT